MSDHLIVFVKNPVPGAVKTRLQTRYSPEQAAAINRTQRELDFLLDHARGLERAGHPLLLRHTRRYLSTLT